MYAFAVVSLILIYAWLETQTNDKGEGVSSIPTLTRAPLSRPHALNV